MTFERVEHKVLVELAELAWSVRYFQKRYFQTRTREELIRSKEAERRLDRLLATALGLKPVILKCSEKNDVTRPPVQNC